MAFGNSNISFWPIAMHKIMSYHIWNPHSLCKSFQCNIISSCIIIAFMVYITIFFFLHQHTQFSFDHLSDQIMNIIYRLHNAAKSFVLLLRSHYWNNVVASAVYVNLAMHSHNEFLAWMQDLLEKEFNASGSILPTAFYSQPSKKDLVVCSAWI